LLAALAPNLCNKKKKNTRLIICDFNIIFFQGYSFRGAISNGRNFEARPTTGASYVMGVEWIRGRFTPTKGKSIDGVFRKLK
jgi:hypothetical protein